MKQIAILMTICMMFSAHANNYWTRLKNVELNSERNTLEIDKMNSRLLLLEKEKVEIYRQVMSPNFDLIKKYEL